MNDSMSGLSLKATPRLNFECDCIIEGGQRDNSVENRTHLDRAMPYKMDILISAECCAWPTKRTDALSLNCRDCNLQLKLARSAR